MKVVFQAKQMVDFLVEASHHKSSRFQKFLARVIRISLCCYLSSSQHLAQLVSTYFFSSSSLGKRYTGIDTTRGKLCLLSVPRFFCVHVLLSYV